MTQDESRLAEWGLRNHTPSALISFSAAGLCGSAVLGDTFYYLDGSGTVHRRVNVLSAEHLEQLQAQAKPIKEIPSLVQVQQQQQKKLFKAKERKDALKTMSRKYLVDDEASAEDAESGSEEEQDLTGSEAEEERTGVDLDDTSGGEDAEEDGYDSLDDYGLDEAEDADLEKTFGDAGEKAVTPPIPLVPVRTSHPSFQPGATEMKDNQRYLAYNSVGLIVSRKDELGYHAVDIEFHDKLGNRPVRFTDDHGFTMAALAKDGAMFASPGRVEAGAVRPSTIHYLGFEGWAGRPFWTLDVEEGEEALGVAIAGPHLLVATSNGWLRSFTPSGIQGPIITFGGDFVTMIGNSSRLLLILDMAGCLVTKLYALPDSQRGLFQPTLVFEGSLGRRADTNRLSWAGLSDSNMAAVMDQTGILYILCDRLGHCWTPLGDYTRLENQHAWPIFFDRQRLTCILCKDDPSPPVLPRPIPTQLEMRPPLLQPDDLANDLQGRVLASHLLTAHISGDVGLRERDLRKLHLTADKHVFELVQLAIKADKQVRVLELCRLFSDAKGFDLAIQLARHNRLASLADRIYEEKEAFIKESEASSEPPAFSTPRLPLAIAKASPSAILADLTPTSHRPAAEDGHTPSRPSGLKRRLELMAAEEDLERLDRIHEESRMADTAFPLEPMEDEQVDVGVEETLLPEEPAQRPQQAQSKTFISSGSGGGLFDMLSILAKKNKEAQSAVASKVNKAATTTNSEKENNAAGKILVKSKPVKQQTIFKK